MPAIEVLPDAVHDDLIVLSDLATTTLDVRWETTPGSYDLSQRSGLTTDGSGRATLNFAPWGGIDVGINGNLSYYDDEGQLVEPWWRAMVGSVYPTSFTNDRPQSFVMVGSGFQPTPAPVELGVNPGAPIITATSVTYLTAQTVWVTIPGHVPGGLYLVQSLNPDERIGFLAGAITLECAVVGDVDCSGQVTLADVLRVAQAWDSSVGNPRYDPACDLDHNNRVDIVDLQRVVTAWAVS